MSKEDRLEGIERDYRIKLEEHCATPQDDTDEMLKTLAQAFSAKMEWEHVKGDDPLKPWVCYQVMRRMGQPIPAWVLNCFDSIAKKLLEIGVVDDSRSHSSQVMAALDFVDAAGRASGKVFSTRNRIWGESWKQYCAVRRYMDEHGETDPNKVFSKIARRMNTTVGTLKNHYYEVVFLRL